MQKLAGRSRAVPPQLRQNIATKEWVIIAPGRAHRPGDFTRKGNAPRRLPAYDPGCPFCAGNEARTPPESFAIPDNGSWKVRVTPNKFPALIDRDGIERHLNDDGIKRRISGVGIHEVIIETPLHNLSAALLSVEQLRGVIRTYRERYLHASSDDRIELVTIFKNHGEMAGTSLEHSHSQLIATPVVPLSRRQRVGQAMAYYDEYGECVFCRIIRDEMRLKERVICETGHFVTIAVYAGTSPFHTWILPKRHRASFGAITDGEIGDLALSLKTFLLKLYHGLNDPDYNLVVRSLPGKVRDNDFIHWYISIIPRITRTAGFELGSGIYINSSLPEEDAAFLRKVGVEAAAVL